MVALGVVAVLALAVVALAGRRSRRRLRTAVDESGAAADRARRLLDGLPDAVLSLDADGAIASANERAAEFTGRSIDELIGRSFIGFVSDDDRDDITDRWRRLRMDADAGTPTAFELVGRDGTPKLVEATLSSRAPTARTEPWSSCATSATARPPRWPSSRPASGSSRRSIRRRPGWHSCGSPTTASSTPTSRSPNCSITPAGTCSAVRCARSHIPRTCVRWPPNGRGSSWASTTATASSSATCDATVSSCGPRPRCR